MSSESLALKSKHDLLSIIVDLIDARGDDFRLLLSHLRLEHLSSEDISLFIDLIDSIDVNDIMRFLPSIYRRLKCKVSGNEIDLENNRRLKGLSIPYKGNKFEGIFSYYYMKEGCNPVTKGIITIENTTNNCQPSASFLVDPEKRQQTNWICTTGNTNDGSFIIDFKDARVSLTGYSLKAHSQVWYNTHFIKSWKIEGSTDKKSWAVIDEQKDSTILQSNLAEGFWPCEQSRPFRFIRIMMTDINSSNCYLMALHAIEFFGFVHF